MCRPMPTRGKVIVVEEVAGGVVRLTGGLPKGYWKQGHPGHPRFVPSSMVFKTDFFQTWHLRSWREQNGWKIANYYFEVNLSTSPSLQLSLTDVHACSDVHSPSTLWKKVRHGTSLHASPKLYGTLSFTLRNTISWHNRTFVLNKNDGDTKAVATTMEATDGDGDTAAVATTTEETTTESTTDDKDDVDGNKTAVATMTEATDDDGDTAAAIRQQRKKRRQSQRRTTRMTSTAIQQRGRQWRWYNGGGNNNRGNNHRVKRQLTRTTMMTMRTRDEGGRRLLVDEAFPP